MHLNELHSDEKEVSAKLISSFSNCNALSIQIKENGLLKEHITKTPALLICVEGHVIYQDEHAQEVVLKAGDYYEIEPMVKHWVKGILKSQLIVLKE